MYQTGFSYQPSTYGNTHQRQQYQQPQGYRLSNPIYEQALMDYAQVSCQLTKQTRGEYK